LKKFLGSARKSKIEKKTFLRGGEWWRVVAVSFAQRNFAQSLEYPTRIYFKLRISMQKRVFVIHGWDGSPQNCWFPWLKNELKKKGFVVQVLSMPHPENPTITDWVNHLADAVGEPDKNTYFVGHSIGCQTILRYIEQLQKPIGGVVCVAGFFRLLHLATDEEKEIAKPWLETIMEYERWLN